MEKKGWKILAIISIAFNLLFFLLVGLGLNQLNEDTDNEFSCFYDVCDVDNLESPAYNYFYDTSLEVCTCYGEYSEIIQETYLGGN